jgi:hypothetical protein
MTALERDHPHARPLDSSQGMAGHMPALVRRKGRGFELYDTREALSVQNKQTNEPHGRPPASRLPP